MGPRLGEGTVRLTAPRGSRTALLTRWESRVGGLMTRMGLDDVRTAIVTLAVVATLIPALATGYLSYRQNQRAINAKLAEQLSGLSTQAARETDLWLKDALYNLRVFATSYEVTDNVARGAAGSGRLGGYLESVGERFPDYDELLVVGPEGRTVASSDSDSRRLRLAGNWLAQARDGEAVLGQPFRRDSSGPAYMELAVPITGPTGRFLGVLAGRLTFRTVEQQLQQFVTGRDDRLAILDRQGTVIVASRAGMVRLPETTIGRLERAEGVPVSFDGPDGTPIVASLAPLPRPGWSVIADVPREAAFADIRRLRNTTALMTLVLLVVVGALAYVLSLLIVRPLGRLSRAANRVAGGDLEIEVPATGGGDLAQLTTVFNDMVRRLRVARDELELLSVTDPLTGLANRRHLMAELERELKRSDRQKRSCAVLMLDVDHFKKFNDSRGHQAGDAVLVGLADVLRDEARDVDTPARYGGEEFLVIVPETKIAGAQQLAERIRARFAESGQTVSLGVAEFPENGTTPEELITAADQAMYRSKESGRNKVTAAG